MQLWNIILYWVASLWLVDAFPAAAAPDPPYCDKIDKYTTGFWNSVFKAPSQNFQWDSNCIFYSKKLTPATRQYTSITFATSIWDNYPCKYYNSGTFKDRPKNELECIWKDVAKQRQYFETMSRSFAQHCKGKVRLMTDAAKKEDIPQDGIWGAVEQVELKKEGSGATEIVAIDRKGKEKFTVWTRGDSAKREVDEVSQPTLEVRDGLSWNMARAVDEWDLTKRENMQTCMSDEEYAAFDDIIEW